MSNKLFRASLRAAVAHVMVFLHQSCPQADPCRLLLRCARGTVNRLNDAHNNQHSITASRIRVFLENESGEFSLPRQEALAVALPTLLASFQTTRGPMQQVPVPR